MLSGPEFAIPFCSWLEAIDLDLVPFGELSAVGEAFFVPVGKQFSVGQNSFRKDEEMFIVEIRTSEISLQCWCLIDLQPVPSFAAERIDCPDTEIKFSTSNFNLNFNNFKFNIILIFPRIDGYICGRSILRLYF